MRSHARVVVIGGGVVGCSVIYHLTKLGWKDVVLIERSELTSGSTWHAAGGFHTLNADTNMAALQGYTIRLYRELEEITGQSCSLHHVGGLTLAETPERLDFLKSARAMHRHMGLDTELVTPEADAEPVPESETAPTSEPQALVATTPAATSGQTFHEVTWTPPPPAQTSRARSNAGVGASVASPMSPTPSSPSSTVESDEDGGRLLRDLGTEQRVAPVGVKVLHRQSPVRERSVRRRRRRVGRVLPGPRPATVDLPREGVVLDHDARVGIPV